MSAGSVTRALVPASPSPAQGLHEPCPIRPIVIRAAARRIVDYALPPRCPGCGIIVADDHSFCLDCWQALEFLGGPACAVCAKPLELALHPDTRCGACLADPPAFDRLQAAVAYGPIARALALKLKHGGRAGIAGTMARQMASLAKGTDLFYILNNLYPGDTLVAGQRYKIVAVE